MHAAVRHGIGTYPGATVLFPWRSHHRTCAYGGLASSFCNGVRAQHKHPGLCDQHHVARRRVDGPEEWTLLGENSPTEETKGGNPKRKTKKERKKREKKRKKRRSAV